MEKNINMEKIWAPWRIKYVSGRKSPGCLFCNKHKAGNDRKNHVVYRGKKVFLIMNIYPYNNGHLMIAPYKHTGDIRKLTSGEFIEIMDILKKTIDALKKILKPQGFNVGFNIGKVSGAGVAGHVHMHVVPRWTGDTNFMPVIGNTKVVSQSLDSLYSELKKYF